MSVTRCGLAAACAARMTVAATGQVGLGDLADLGRGKIRDVGRDLGEGRDQRRQPGTGLGHAATKRVPGDDRCAEAERLRKRHGHRRAIFTERGKRADGAAQRGDENAVAQRRPGGGAVGDAGEPDGGLVAEGDRRGMLAIGAPDARRRAEPLGEASEPVDDRDEVCADQLKSVAHLQDERAVGDVLGRRPAMEVRLERSRQPRLHRLDERDDRHAGEGRVAAELRNIEIVGRDLLDRRSQVRRHDAVRRLGARQRRLDRDHRCDAAPVGKDRAHPIAREQRPEHLRVERGKGHLNSPLPARTAARHSFPPATAWRLASW